MGVINHPIVGRVPFTPLGGGRIALGNWPAEHIKTAFVPQLAGVPTYGGTKFSGKVPFYGPAIPQLVAAWAEVEKQGLLHRVIFWGGSFVPRMKRGSTTSPSEHTFGCAFDINPAENPFRHRPAQKGEKGYLLDLCPIFEEFSFECGAKWHQPDGMHFQIKRLMGNVQVKPPVAAPVTMKRGLALNDGKTIRRIEEAVLLNGHNIAPVADTLEAAGLKIATDEQHTKPDLLVLKVWKP